MARVSCAAPVSFVVVYKSGTWNISGCFGQKPAIRACQVRFGPPLEEWFAYPEDVLQVRGESPWFFGRRPPRVELLVRTESFKSFRCMLFFVPFSLVFRAIECKSWLNITPDVRCIDLSKI